MISVAFLAVIVIVALVCLALGMSISHHSSRPQPHQSMPQTHESRTHSGGSGSGVAVLLVVLCVLIAIPVVFWVLLQSNREVQQATIVTETAHTHELGDASGEKVVSDRVTRPLLDETAGESTTLVEVEPAAGATGEDQPGELSGNNSEVERAAPSGGAVAEAWEPAPVRSSTTRSVNYKVHSIPTPGMFSLGLICLASLIGAGIWIAHRRQHWSLSGMARSTVRSLWVVPILAAVGWVGYLVWPHLSIEPLARNTDYNPSQTEFDRYVDETQAQFQPGTSGMPAWVTDGMTSQNGLVHVPVHGGWHSNENEAEAENEARNEARAQALRTIQQDFRLTYPSAEDWRVDVTLDELHAVRAEYVETRLITYLGEEQPTYRVHLLVELSDEVRGELANRWIPELREYRMGMLLTFGGLLTAVCFAGATCLNLDLRTEGHYRRWLRTATVLVVVAAAAIAYGVLNSLWFPHSV